MTIRVHKSGAVVRVPFLAELGKPPEEQAVMMIRFLNWDEERKLVAASARIGGGTSENQLDAMRKILGIALVGIEGLKIVNEAGEEEDFVLERAGNEITRESMSILWPWLAEISEAINRVHSFGLDDRKN